MIAAGQVPTATRKAEQLPQFAGLKALQRAQAPRRAQAVLQQRALTVRANAVAAPSVNGAAAKGPQVRRAVQLWGQGHPEGAITRTEGVGGMGALLPRSPAQWPAHHRAQRPANGFQRTAPCIVHDWATSWQQRLV